MHFMLPLYVAIIGMMVVYTMYSIDLKHAAMTFLIVIVENGFGGVLEMVEHTYDKKNIKGSFWTNHRKDSNARFTHTKCIRRHHE